VFRRKSTEWDGRDLNALHIDELAVKMFVVDQIRKALRVRLIHFFNFIKKWTALRIFNVIGIIGYTYGDQTYYF